MEQQQEAPQGTPPPPGDEEPEFDFEGAFERLAGEKCRCAPGCGKQHCCRRACDQHQ